MVRAFITCALVGGPLITLAVLTACATPGSAPPPTPIPTPTCLPLKTYTAAQEAEAAKELAGLPVGSTVAQFVTDYGQMRAADRAACSK